MLPASTLADGVTYMAVARGTARIARDATGVTDAEYIRYNTSTGPQDGSSPGYAPHNHGVRLAGVDGGTTGGNLWGAYQADHQYVREFVGQGTILTGYYSDLGGHYDDNNGMLNVDLYMKPQPEVRVEITDINGSPVGLNDLKVAKWQNAFEPDLDAQGQKVYTNFEGNPTTKDRGYLKVKVREVDPNSGLDAIDLDPDRFNVWVYNLQKWNANTPHISVKISTTNVSGFNAYDDAPNEVDLIPFKNQPNLVGWFWSESQLLVSNKADDVETVPGSGADESAPGNLGPQKSGGRWRTSDRTHKIALRGTVKAEYDVLPATANSPAEVVKYDAPVALRHFVHVHVNAMKGSILAPTLSVEQANKKIMDANETFAQVGILLIPSINTDVEGPDGVTLDDGLDVATELGIDLKVVIMPEMSALLVPSSGSTQLRTPPPQGINISDDIELYFIPFFTGLSVQGLSIPKFASPDDKYTETSIVQTRLDFQYLTTHELGHLLSNDGHYIGTEVLESVNLMRAGLPPFVDSLLGPKRLTVAQDERLNSARPNLLK